jgi:hypothetical protein
MAAFDVSEEIALAVAPEVATRSTPGLNALPESMTALLGAPGACRGHLKSATSASISTPITAAALLTSATALKASETTTPSSTGHKTYRSPLQLRSRSLSSPQLRTLPSPTCRVHSNGSLKIIRSAGRHLSGDSYKRKKTEKLNLGRGYSLETFPKTPYGNRILVSA